MIFGSESLLCTIYQPAFKFDEAVHMIQNLGGGCLIGKSDITGPVTSTG